MASTTTAISLSSQDFLSTLNPKTISSLTLRTTKLTLSFSTTISPKTTITFNKNATPVWRTRATATEAPPLAEAAKEIVSAAADDGGGGASSVAVSALLVVAFVGLSILTIGVIYIAVTDFLQKRETEKFEKQQEEAEKRTGKKKKKKAKARAGPRGFGQKIDEDIND